MSITPPSEDEGEIGNARLAIDAVNSDVSIVEAIRTMTPDTPATVEIVVAIASAPDATPELDLGEFSWRNVEWNKTIASGDLTYDDTLDIVVPGYDCTPENTPGVF